MFPIWTTSAFLLAAVFGVHSAHFDYDDSVEKVKHFIADLDTYLEDNSLSEFQLPNIGILPINPVRLRNGTFGKFSTLEIHGEPDVKKTKNNDGTRAYEFDVKLGLKELNIQYDFSVNILRLYRKEGHITISTQVNELEASGVVVIQSDESCDATLYSAKYLKYEGFKVDLEPDDFPYFTEVSETVINYITPKILPVTNAVLTGVLFYPSFQNKFSEFICDHWDKF